MKINQKLAPYLPGILLFLLALIVSLITYKEYGMGWDEPTMRGPGLLNFNYMMHGSNDLFKKDVDNHHGAAYELVLIFIEKGLRLKDSRDIYEMRHIVTHIFFLLSAFCAYVLTLRLFKDKWLASLSFLMIVLNPRLYGHSFINSKDIPFMCMTIVTLMLSQIAFEKDRKWLFLLLGLACGYATSIRIMGVMFVVFIGAFLLLDLISDMKKKEKPIKQLINMAMFGLGFCLLLYISWPFLWKSPVHKFNETFSTMSHFGWTGSVLFEGKIIVSTQIPPNYFPVWFFISNPLLWLLAGFAGLILIGFDFFKKPIVFFQNTQERNFLLYIACFLVPIFAVIALHSVIYDDWRHLYFVYPAFVFMGIYAVHKIWKGKIKIAVQAICGTQVAFILFFMVANYPFQYVYFNPLVSHDEEFLRRNYEMEYWGTSMKQGLEYLLENDTAKVITVCATYKGPLDNNILMLPPDQRKRFAWTEDAMKGDYFLTNFRLHPEDYPDDAHAFPNIEYDIKVLNSTIMRIYFMKPKKTALGH